MVKPRTLELLLPDGTLNIQGVIDYLAEKKTPEEILFLKEAIDLVREIGVQVLTPVKATCLKQGLAMSLLLNDLGLDISTLAAAIICDTYLAQQLPISRIEKMLGKDVATLVVNVEKIQGVNVEHSLQQIENLRRLLLAVVEDVRGVLIRLAKQTIEMREVIHCEQAIRNRYAKETQELYAPLANRLGIGQIKWELEDLAFRILEPGGYKYIAKLLDERRVVREQYIDVVVSEIKNSLIAQQIENKVFGRAKHIYSIWKKMHRKGIAYHEIHDVHAVRIIVSSVRDCYAALGIVHGLWQHIPKEFDDYIANPKENGYRSLHTAVIGPLGKTLEIQIRTDEMHKQAELGVAAHWLYKEGGSQDTLYETKLAHLRQVLSWEEAWDQDTSFSDALKREVFQDRVYVLTPKGKVIDLPATATVLDFAYTIHTDVGHHCRGAKVNHRMVPLTHPLKSGDQVEIITTKSGGPSRDWLNPEAGYLTTMRARTKVHQWFKRQDREQNISEGREVLERELKRLSIENLSFEALAGQLKIAKVEDMLASIGSGDLRSNQILAAIQILAKPLTLKKIPPKLDVEALLKPRHPTLPSKTHAAEIVVAGVGNLLCYMARCCKPVPGDEIIGYISQGRGVSIHRKDCANILHASTRSQTRFIQVEWGKKIEHPYLTDIKIQAYDRPLLLRDISAILGAERINVADIKMGRKPDENIIEFHISIEIASIESLGKTLHKLSQVPNVVDARRIQT